jgi:hypothetical protein
MTQEVVINKVLRDLKISGWVMDEDVPYVRPLLNAIYTAGWEMGRKSDNNHLCEKPVVQYDRTGKKIADFPSVTIAANKLHVTRDGLYKAISKGTVTKKGYIWRYL